MLARQDASGQLLDPPELDVGSPALDARQEAAERERQAEDRRLLYVALTRGKHQCRVYWTANKGGAMSALGQLLFPALTDTETDGMLEDQLRQWAAERGVERIAVRGPDARRAIRDPGRYRPPRDSTVTLHCRPVARPSLPPLLQTSFSALASAAAEAGELEAADRDELPPEPPAESRAIAAGAEPGDGRLPLAEMPGGRLVGDLAHRVLEELLTDGRCRAAERTAVRDAAAALLATQLPRANLDAVWQVPLAECLADCLTWPLSASHGSQADFPVFRGVALLGTPSSDESGRRARHCLEYQAVPLRRRAPQVGGLGPQQNPPPAGWSTCRPATSPASCPSCCAWPAGTTTSTWRGSATPCGSPNRRWSAATLRACNGSAARACGASWPASSIWCTVGRDAGTCSITRPISWARALRTTMPSDWGGRWPSTTTCCRRTCTP